MLRISDLGPHSGSQSRMQKGDGGFGINVAPSKARTYHTPTRLKFISVSLEKMADGGLKECESDQWWTWSGQSPKLEGTWDY